jgi:hypothetical protein
MDFGLWYERYVSLALLAATVVGLWLFRRKHRPRR